MTQIGDVSVMDFSMSRNTSPQQNYSQPLLKLVNESPLDFSRKANSPPRSSNVTRESLIGYGHVCSPPNGDLPRKNMAEGYKKHNAQMSSLHHPSKHQVLEVSTNHFPGLNESRPHPSSLQSLLTGNGMKMIPESASKMFPGLKRTPSPDATRWSRYCNLQKFQGNSSDNEFPDSNPMKKPEFNKISEKKPSATNEGVTKFHNEVLGMTYRHQNGLVDPHATPMLTPNMMTTFPPQFPVDKRLKSPQFLEGPTQTKKQRPFKAFTPEILNDDLASPIDVPGAMVNWPCMTPVNPTHAIASQQINFWAQNYFHGMSPNQAVMFPSPVPVDCNGINVAGKRRRNSSPMPAAEPKQLAKDQNHSSPVTLSPPMSNNSNSDTNEGEDSGNRKKGCPMPDAEKDEAYWNKRRKNNLAAKKSRDNRRLMEDELALRAKELKDKLRHSQINCQVLWEENRQMGERSNEMFRALTSTIEVNADLKEEVSNLKAMNADKDKEIAELRKLLACRLQISPNSNSTDDLNESKSSTPKSEDSPLNMQVNGSQ